MSNNYTDLPQNNLDDTDLFILNELQNDGKSQYRDLALKIGKALGTISNRVQKLESTGIIENWSVRVNAEKLGYDLTCFINITMDVRYINEINTEIRKIPELFGIYNVTGDFDIIAIGRFLSRKHVYDTIQKILAIPYIIRTSSTIALGTIKEDHQIHLFKGMSKYSLEKVSFINTS